MYLPASEHLPKIDTAVPTYYGWCQCCAVRWWQIERGGTERDSAWSSGPKWEDHRSHFWSAARCSLLIIVKGLISEAQQDLYSCLFLSYPLYPPPSVPPPFVARHHLSYLRPARSVIHMHSVTTSTVWFPPTPLLRTFKKKSLLLLLLLFILSVLSSPPDFGCFLASHFHHCQSRLLKKPLSPPIHLSGYFLLRVTLCSTRRG